VRRRGGCTQTVTCARCLDSILQKCGHSAAGEQAAVASVKHLVRALTRSNHAGGFLADAWQPLQRAVTIVPPSELATLVPTLLPLVSCAAQSTDWHHRLAAAALLSALARWVDHAHPFVCPCSTAYGGGRPKAIAGLLARDGELSLS
jgi:hypothetical protein